MTTITIGTKGAQRPTRAESLLLALAAMLERRVAARMSRRADAALRQAAVDDHIERVRTAAFALRVGQPSG